MERPLCFTTEFLQTNTAERFENATQRAADLLRDGQLVALPTETVYGLAANALDAEATSQVYVVKGRPTFNPIIVHVASLEMAKDCVTAWPDSAERLVSAFWPGPLTLVLPRSDRIPDVVTAGGPTVGVRWPSHPVIQEVIRRCGFPIAAPSANPANRVSPTTAQHVLDYFSGKIPLIVDGGSCQVGIESTVLDLSVDPPRLLRPGMIHEPSLLAVLGRLGQNSKHAAGPLRSPGQLRKHYSPRAALRTWHGAKTAGSLLKDSGAPSKKVAVIAHTHVPSSDLFSRVAVLPHEPTAFARALYAELHACDAAGAAVIWVEEPPSTEEWRGVADRLRRAAA